MFYKHHSSCLRCQIFSSPEPKAHGELIVYQSAGVRLCVHASMRPHFQTLISLRPVDQLQPNFI